MAEELQRSRLYEYKANSNLVLEAERDGRRREEGSAEVESLHGKLGEIRMGDRISATKRSVELLDRIENAKKSKSLKSGNEYELRKKINTISYTSSMGKSSLLMETEELGVINYRPKTRESKVAYEEILNLIQQSLGDQPHDIIRGACDEIISILKNEEVRENLKLGEVEKIIGACNKDRFHKLFSLSKKLSDFSLSNVGETSDKQPNDDDEEMGVAVVFEDEDESDKEVNEVGDSDEDDDEEGVEANGSGQLRGRMEEGDDKQQVGDGKYEVSIFDIDAHWLQRHLSKYYPDANISSKLAEDTLSSLHIADERVCENRLVVLLDFDKFELIKLLLKNRYKIYYCVKLKQAQSESERSTIEQEMMSDGLGRGQAILQQLMQKASAESWTQDRIGEFANKARREARALNHAFPERKTGSSAEGNGTEEPFLNFSIGGTEDISHLGESANLVDLESLSFKQGSHFMSNKSCELPEKSWRALKKGYEEVHVPAVRPVIPPSEKLVEVRELPSWCQDAFDGIKSLNRIQSKMVNAALMSAENLLLCAPTGAGKTNVALLCMLNQIGNFRLPDGSYDLNAFKIVYIAPMKALVQECVQNFGKRLAKYGITVKELSGDQSLTRQQIQETQIIVTTPEKWDIVTRKSGDRTYTQLVRLMIIDEIHLLHDDRGPVLEAIVARTIRQVETTQEMVRLVGLSATLPNFEDVATFLRVKPDKGLFFFDNSFRPVPLQQQYIGITEKKALKRFQLMNEICYEKVLQHAGRNQILIFTHSRADTVKTAKALRDLAVENDTISSFIREDSASREILKEEAETAVKNGDLKDTLPYGFAFHHAGLVRSDRTLVEDLFADKHIQVLVSTATLAWGVNLPCHTVIIKGTQMYSPIHGRWVELSPLDILQMMGRAGRFGLDSEGEGIIMTTHSELQFYLSLLNQQLPIESQMIKKLPDMLNAEIVLGNVSSVREAASWLGYTYLFVRMLRNPSLYGITEYDAREDRTLIKARMNFIHSAASLLDKDALIKYDKRSGRFQSTAIGRVASYYYVTHDSIRTYNDFMKPVMSDIEIFRLFSISNEFKDIHVREEEKLELTKLISRVPIPVKESIDEPSAKVNVLLQAYISRLKLEGFSLAADMIFIQQSSCRLMRALFEIALKRGWSALAQKFLNICKIVERRTWLSQSPLRQFGTIPEVIIRRLERSSDITWDRYFDLKPQDLGEMVKTPKMGKALYKYVHAFPKVELTTHFLPITRSLLKVDLTITPDFQFDPQIHDFSQLFWIIVEDVDGKNILHYESFLLQGGRASEDHHVTFFVPLSEPLPPQYFVKVLSDRFLHSETTLPVSFRHLILPQKFPPCAELLDLQPLPISALGNKVFEKVFQGISRFNPIQTQTFKALYESDGNVLICAPESSGKSTCASIAITRHFLSGANGKCVYLNPIEDIIDQKCFDWFSKFHETFGANVAKLTGEVSSDLKLLEENDILLCTPANWDTLSRRWRQRKSVQNVSLFICDNLHLIGGSYGPLYEIVLSRTRYIASQVETSVRIVGLSVPLANAKDVGDWLGVSPSFIYNFLPGARPIPLELYFAGFDHNHVSTRLLSMAKPAFNIACGSGNAKSTILFVSSHKQAQLTAIDFVSFAAASGQSKIFLGNTTEDEEYFDTCLGKILDQGLSQTIAFGVGICHSSLPASDRALVQKLFAEGYLKVLICSHEVHWSLNVTCQNVVVMDNVYYEGREHRFVDYDIADVMHMLGLSCQSDTGFCKGFILCHTSKREYLKKVLQDPIPIESHLDQYLHDFVNTEIVAKSIENKQDAVDYLTWSFYYRRIAQNPNYYNLQGTSHRHLSDHLSELVENVTTDLQSSKCISIDDDFDLSALNHGMIASYYSIQYITVELLTSSVTPKTKTKGLLEVLAAAAEFLKLPLRSGEETALRRIFSSLDGAAVSTPPSFSDPAAKVLVLLQAHFSRSALPVDLYADLQSILKDSLKLLQACVDVISSQGWLRPALAAMELTQMITQGIWNKDSILLQIPHFDKELVNRCLENDPKIETVFDVIDMDDEDRVALLDNLSNQKMSDVAMFCNSYPSVDLAFQLSATEVTVNGSVVVKVTLDQEEGSHEVANSRFSHKRFSGWWLVIGDYNNNILYSIKKIGNNPKTALEFSAPSDPGDYNLMLYLMSDSYLGCDQEFEFNIVVVPDDE